MVLAGAVVAVGPLSDFHARRDLVRVVLLANDIKAGDKHGRAQAWTVR